MSTTYGYARVSTLGQSLEEQRDDLERYGVEPENLFEDKFTGRSMDRPGLEKLKGVVKKGDVIAVTKLDRLGRRTKDVLELIDWCRDKGVTLDIQNVGRLKPDEDDPTTRLLWTMLAAFADMERDLIVQRTQEGKAIARKDPNWREGRPRITTTHKDHKIVDYAASHSVKETAEMAGVSERTVYRIMRRVKEEREAARKEG